jgi:hypothetical protein
MLLYEYVRGMSSFLCCQKLPAWLLQSPLLDLPRWPSLKCVDAVICSRFSLRLSVVKKGPRLTTCDNILREYRIIIEAAMHEYRQMLNRGGSRSRHLETRFDTTEYKNRKFCTITRFSGAFLLHRYLIWTNSKRHPLTLNYP